MLLAACHLCQAASAQDLMPTWTRPEPAGNSALDVRR